MEVYINGMLVKPLRAEEHLKHLQETFNKLRKYNTKLNPKKCAFEAGSDKFLGFMVSNRGIEINPNKIKAIEDITVIDNVKAMQRLTGGTKVVLIEPAVTLYSERGRPTLLVFGSLKNSGLKLAKRLGAEAIEAKWDSLLVVNQVNKTFEVREDRMQRYLDKLQMNLHRFKEWTLQHVLREQNNEADTLANLGSSVEDDGLNSGTVVQLMRSVIEEGNAEINSTSLTWDWRNKYI
uniref:Uncharacterized protein LOC104236174 n=1 Tax=Nicotiana sylvestris TaxID=4096 RepID=A0A1U7XFC3_NICSY|nr:PREDICTED: uncharacterized protein LOC104236174 [Nicotiana sylvestris]